MPYNLPFETGQSVIELGGGDRPIFRPNLDSRKSSSVDIAADLNEPLPLENSKYDGAFCSYALEHVSWRKVRNLISEVRRILKPGGKAVFVTANLYEQAKYIVQKESEGWTDKEVCCIFGDQDYPENNHKSGFSPSFAFDLFQEAGFEDVLIIPHGELRTDMVIEARKPIEIPDPNKWTVEDRQKFYNRHYFDGGRGIVGGYSKEGYWDYPVHWVTYNKIMERKPSSVLEIGAARGYILKRLIDYGGIPAFGLEVSQHCLLTGVVGTLKLCDIAIEKWPVADYDLAFSCAVLEHIPEDRIEFVAKELERTTRRGLHGVDFGHHDDGFDKTHCNFKPKEWWQKHLPKGHEVVDKEELERGQIVYPKVEGLKLNIGSFTTMFPGWVNIDQHPLEGFAKNHNYTYIRHDVRQGLPYESGCVDMIYACHFLEHLTEGEGLAFLRECHRVLKKDGLIRIILPDTNLLIEQYKTGSLSQYNEINDGCAEALTETGKLWQLLFSGHQSLYDWNSIYGLMKQIGFNSIRNMGFRMSLSQEMLHETLDMYPTLSLFVEAVK